MWHRTLNSPGGNFTPLGVILPPHTLAINSNIGKTLAIWGFTISGQFRMSCIQGQRLGIITTGIHRILGNMYIFQLLLFLNEKTVVLLQQSEWDMCISPICMICISHMSYCGLIKKILTTYLLNTKDFSFNTQTTVLVSVANK